MAMMELRPDEIRDDPDLAEHLRTYARDEKQVWFAQELDRRFLLGARYRF